MPQIFCKNTGTSKEFPEGTSLLEMLPAFEFERPFPIVSAKVNNVSQGLKFKAFNNREIEFVDVRDTSGMRIYSRSLFFLLCRAAQEVLPGCRVYIEHPLSGGYYCNVHKEDSSALTDADITLLRSKMREIVSAGRHFHRTEARVQDAVKIFSESGNNDKVRLLETCGEVYIDYYTLMGVDDFYYGKLVPSTDYLQVWDIERCHDGLLLRMPDHHNPSELAPMIPQPKAYEVFSENLRWNIITRLNNVGDLNMACRAGRGTELIQVSEALQEKKIVQIAEEIESRYYGKDQTRLILVTGPSSSGKTTVCKRLCIQLKACGLRPQVVSTDDYFVNRLDTPRLPDGSFDFDNFDTVDHDALQKDILKFLAGEDVSVPEFNFVTGLREYNGKHIKMGQGTVLIVEGIHALNPALTDLIPEKKKFRIFISTMTSIALDNHNCIPTSDNRLLRRIIRDYNKGAFTAIQTIDQWQNVCEAEEKWISPYQENADVIFNSSYLVEFAVLRNHAEPILESVPKNCPQYTEAHRLLHFLSFFNAISDKDIPPTSLIREFVGGSSFKY